MTNTGLDDIDIKIIRLLQKDGRISVADMARNINEITENAIRYRIERLESDGYISNYTVHLDSKKFGKNIIAIFYLNVLPDKIDPTLEFLKSFEYITDVYLTTGKYSIFAVGYFDDRDVLTKFITENLKRIKLIDYDVATVLQRVKHELYSI